MWPPVLKTAHVTFFIGRCWQMWLKLEAEIGTWNKLLIDMFYETGGQRVNEFWENALVALWCMLSFKLHVNVITVECWIFSSLLNIYCIDTPIDITVTDACCNYCGKSRICFMSFLWEFFIRPTSIPKKLCCA